MARSIIYDAGGLIALERRAREAVRPLEFAAGHDLRLITSAACVAQVWRDGSRQVTLARALADFFEFPLDAAGARRVGAILAKSDTADVVDASLVGLASDGDLVVTTDPADLRRLADARGISLEYVTV